MPRVIIRTIREDRAGNIWFATFGGPIRYDGKSFTNFSEEVGLAKTRVFSLLEARSGALWFGSITGGASRFDGKSVTKFTAKDGLANNDVVWIFEDRDANIWFATGAGVSRYDGKAMTTSPRRTGSSNWVIRSPRRRRIWFGTQGGISRRQVVRQSADRRATVREHSLDGRGPFRNLWFGGRAGGPSVRRQDGGDVHVQNGLLDDFVGSIADRAGTSGAASRAFPAGARRREPYDGKTFQHFTQKDGPAALPSIACSGTRPEHPVRQCRRRVPPRPSVHPFSATKPSVTTAGPAARKQPLTVAKAHRFRIEEHLGCKGQDNNYWFGVTVGASMVRREILTQFTTKHGRPTPFGNQGDVKERLHPTVEGVSKYDGRTFIT
jgi:hypothetical protein